MNDRNRFTTETQTHLKSTAAIVSSFDHLFLANEKRTEEEAEEQAEELPFVSWAQALSYTERKK